MKKYPLVCVLILNWNRWQITCDCVDSVLKSTYPNFRVAVIDNGSTDKSVFALQARFGDRIVIIACSQIHPAQYRTQTVGGILIPVIL